MTYRQIVDHFLEVYGGNEEGIRVFEAPGRVNLIGEHIDYNGGVVFPAALTLSNVTVVRPNGANVIRLAVTSLPNRVIADIDKLDSYREIEWGNYQLGMAYILQKQGIPIIGCDMLYHGTVPYGGGLSSSASIEVVTAVALLALAGKALPSGKVAQLAQKAENEYAGVNCGIMDQFASVAGKKDHAILLNCDSLRYELIPLALGEYQLIIIDSNKKHKLTESKYNERREECDRALHSLQACLPDLPSLCAATPKQLEDNKDLMPDEVVYRRARHAISENARTLEAAKKLQSNDLAGFGDLMKQSHISLRDDYESTGKELDAIFELGCSIEGVLGIRATGAGFGGSAVAVVHRKAVPEFKVSMLFGYRDRIGYDCTCYECGIGDGGREISWREKSDVEQGLG